MGIPEKFPSFKEASGLVRTAFESQQTVEAVCPETCLPYTQVLVSFVVSKVGEGI